MLTQVWSRIEAGSVHQTYAPCNGARQRNPERRLLEELVRELKPERPSDEQGWSRSPVALEYNVSRSLLGPEWGSRCSRSKGSKLWQI